LRSLTEYGRLLVSSKKDYLSRLLAPNWGLVQENTSKFKSFI
jgi:hypothetical protein